MAWSGGAIALWLASLTVLAGCSSGDGGSKAPPSANEIIAPGDVNPDAGIISGFVVDDQKIPLADASVGIRELSLEARTNDEGAFLFSNIAPGTYHVDAMRLGYVSVSLEVQLDAQEEEAVELELIPLPPETEPWTEVKGPEYGYFECRLATSNGLQRWTGTCGTVCLLVTCVGPPAAAYPNDRSILRFNVTSDKVATVIGEMRWSPSAYATSTDLRLAFSHDNRTGTHWWCAGEGPSPIQWRWNFIDEDAGKEDRCQGSGIQTGADDEEPLPRTGLGLRIYANTPFSDLDVDDPDPAYLTLQQRIEMAATVFYVEAAAEPEYTIFGA